MTYFIYHFIDNLIVVDFVPSSFVAIGVAVCDTTLCSAFAFSEMVVAVVVLEISLCLALCPPDSQ